MQLKGSESLLGGPARAADAAPRRLGRCRWPPSFFFFFLFLFLYWVVFLCSVVVCLSGFTLSLLLTFLAYHNSVVGLSKDPQSDCMVNHKKSFKIKKSKKILCSLLY